MEPKTKQYLLVTVVGVTLFVALLRLSTVLAFAAELVDLVLPILAGGILALFINVPMSGLEKRLTSASPMKYPLFSFVFCPYYNGSAGWKQGW